MMPGWLPGVSKTDMVNRIQTFSQGAIDGPACGLKMCIQAVRLLRLERGTVKNESIKDKVL
jgi:hypothetical protein